MLRTMIEEPDRVLALLREAVPAVSRVLAGIDADDWTIPTPREEMARP